MLKINHRLSALISLSIAIAAGILIIVLFFTMPMLIDTYLNSLTSVLCNMRGTVIAFAYLSVAVVFIADILLILLLQNINKHIVFIPSNVAFLRGISWCCFLECFIMLIFSFVFPFPYSPITAVIGFIAIFLGIVLRVVKNVIEEASVIKEENDFTI